MELVVLMGLPGSGKSSYYRHAFAKTHQLVSKDLMKNKRNKGQIQAKQIAHYLSEGKSVVVDNTNITRLLRKDLIDLAHQFNARALLYFFPSTVSESLERNMGPFRKEVPSVAIYSFHKQLELPDISESFDAVYEVEMISPETFSKRKLF